MKKSSLPQIDFRAIADDFRDLNPRDIGAWPLIPRVTVLATVFVIIVAAGWWLVWRDQLDVLEARKMDEARLKDEFVVKKRQAVNLDLYVQQLNEIDRSFGTLLKQLPNKAEVEALLVEINQAGLGRGLLFDLFRPGPEVVKDFYAELPITVKLLGSYHDFGEFAADIAKLSRIVTLNNISISPPGKDGILTMDAVTKTFRYLDEDELSKQKKTAPAKGANK